MRKLLKALSVSLLAFLLVSQFVYAAATYYAVISIVESGNNDYTALPLIYDMTTSNLVDNGFMDADALDSMVIDQGSLEHPHLFADDKLLFVDDVEALTSDYDLLTLGNTPAASMPIIVGYDGYFEVADAAALEPDDDFEIEIDGYFKAPDSGTETWASKGTDLIIDMADDGDINASIAGTPAVNVSHTAAVISDTVYGAEWLAQTFQPTVSGYITSVRLWLSENSNPAGNFNCYIYATSGGKPTGSALTSDSMLAADINGADEEIFTFDTPAYLTSGTLYAVVCSAPNADVSHQVAWYSNNANTYANGTPCTSSDSGATWATGTNDFYFITYMSQLLTITAATVSDGEHNIIIAADGVDFTITVDTVEEDSVALAGAAVGNNGSDWLFMANNVIAYANYIDITVSSALIAHYMPEDIIVGDALPDLEGAAQDGDITWGTNPAGITITLGGLISYNQPNPALPPATQFGSPVLPVITQPGWTATQDMSTNPAYPLVHAFDEATTFTENQIWIFFASGLMIFAMIFVFRYFPHVAASMMVGIVVSGLWVAMGIYPFWVIFVFVVGFVASLIFERTQSV